GPASFSPEGRLVVTASDDGTARVWGADTGAAVTPPLRHGDAVLHAAFSPDGRRIITSCKDGLARVWDLPAADGLPEHMGLRAELLSSHRLDAAGGLGPPRAPAPRRPLGRRRTEEGGGPPGRGRRCG